MRYWVYMNGEVPGSYAASELTALPGFSMTTLICPAQGEIAEKNWRRAGEFGDVADALRARESAAAPPPPATMASAAAAAAASSSADALIDSTSTKLFGHVADLMKELEGRREEKGLVTSLQSRLAALNEELAQTRERSNLLEMRLPRIAALEETHRQDQAALERLRSDLLAREKSLAEKESSLAKSLDVIRRLEEDLGRLCSERTPPAAEVAPAPQETSLPSAPLALDESPPPPYLDALPPGERPKAQEALVNFLKRIFPGQPH